MTRNSVLALATMAAAGAASAQSSLTLFGIVDTAVTWGRGNGAGSADKVSLTSGNYNTSRLGIRGTEDLGGGMSASFWLEAGLNTDDGTGQNSNTNNQASTQPVALEGITFNRRSTVSLAGNWGELRLGRDYVPQYNNRTQFDPFGNVGVSQTVVNNLAITGVTSSRASNTVAYFLPAQAGGFYGQAMYYMGENPSTAGATHRDGSGYGGRLGYVTGPFNVAVASGYTRYAAGGARQSNIGGQWDLPVVKLMGEYELETSGTTKAKGWMIGGLLPVGVGQIRLSYSRMTIERANAEPRSNKLALGYVHNLSKRTALYTNYAHVSNSAGASLALGGATTAANNASNGVDLGIRHSF